MKTLVSQFSHLNFRTMKTFIPSLSRAPFLIFIMVSFGLLGCLPFKTTETTTKPTGTQSPSPPAPISNKDMLEVDYLGVGYDAVRVDPENLAKNSVNNKSLAPPPVFAFTPSQNNFFTVIKARGDGKGGEEVRVVPIGVIARAGERSFLWSNKARWAMNASEFQHSFSHSYSGNVGIPDLASVKLSASFEDVQSVTSSSEAAYVYKDGSYSGHVLKLDLTAAGPKMLSETFNKAVAALGTNDPLQYDAFIQSWGTHFSLENTMGAKCFFRFTLTKSGYSNSNKSKKAFEEGVELSVGEIQGGIGAKQADEQATKAENEMSAQQTVFKSFGGSGVSENFGVWSKDAQHNPTIIDVRLTSYLELFNQNFFPGDSQIKAKYNLLDAALKRYYLKNKYTETVNPADFYKLEPQNFTVSVKRLYVKQGNKDNSFEERLYGGILKLGVYDAFGNEKNSKLFMNLNGGAWMDWGQWKYNCIKKAQGDTQVYSDYFNITLTPEQLANTFATITGEMTQTWLWGTDQGKKSMGMKTAFDTQNALRALEIINLNTLNPGETKQSHVTYTNTDVGQGDIVEIYFEVKRTK